MHIIYIYDGFQKTLTYTFGNAYLKLCICVALLRKLSWKPHFPEVFRKFSGSFPGSRIFRYTLAQGILKPSYIYMYREREREIISDYTRYIFLQALVPASVVCDARRGREMIGSL